jgi:hypothetical protein
MNLLPCPFCGALPVMYGDDDGDLHIECNNDACLIQPSVSEMGGLKWRLKWREKVGDIVLAWNTRK